MIIHEGSGVLNTIKNKLPVELDIPGYQYCGHGTKLAKRLARGNRRINPLDTVCKEHDIAYSQNRDTRSRNEADEILARKAWEKFRVGDSSIGEKAAALSVTGIMKTKSKLGMGLREKTLKSIIDAAEKSIPHQKMVK